MPKPTFFNLPEDKRNLILELAIDEFAGQDYDKASISNIVARAGIAKGSFYQYFEDKRDLYLYLVDLAGAEKKRFLAQHPPPDPAMGLFDYLRWLVRVGTSFEFAQPKMAQVAYRAVFGDRPFGDEALDRLRRSALDYYRSLLEMGVAQGCVDPQIDMDTAVFIISTLFTEFGRHLVERLQLSADDLGTGKLKYEDLEGFERDLISFLERGLRPLRGPEEENPHAGRQAPVPRL